MILVMDAGYIFSSASLDATTSPADRSTMTARADRMLFLPMTRLSAANGKVTVPVGPSAKG